MNARDRVPVCGTISSYNGPPQPVFGIFNLIYKRVRMEGFVATKFAPLSGAFMRDMPGWLKDGRMKHQETLLDWFERAPDGLIGLFEGQNTGKMLIRIAD